MMDEKIFIAIKNNEIISLLRGDELYIIENSQYAPGAEITDVGKVLSGIIYKSYEIRPDIKERFEEALLEMLNKTDFDVCMVIIYIVTQLFKEKNELSPFTLDMKDILPKVKDELEKRRENIKQGIIYPSGFKNSNAWDDIRRFNHVSQEEYNIKLF